METNNQEYNNNYSSFMKINSNDEYNDLYLENESLYLELNKYRVPNIFYNSYQEFENIKTNAFNELKNYLIDITKTNEYIIFYDKFECPLSLNKKVEEIMKTILKDDEVSFVWIKEKTKEIILHLNIFLKSMTLYPEKIISNELYLVNIIFENIKLQMKEFLNKIPLIKCNVCKQYYNIIDYQNICGNCSFYNN